MRPVQKWHFTPIGKAALFLGSIELAVPIMVMVAVAMAWGTYLESKHGVQTSRATVYGSWWFIVLMGLICVSLIFAVIARFPWKRKHVGFMTVHTGLVMLIIGGFWSLFGRIEGHMALKEGASSSQLETDQELLALTEFKSANDAPLAEAAAPHTAESVTLADVHVRVVEWWENIREEQYVANDGEQPLRAVELAFDEGTETGQWVAEETRGGAPTLNNLVVRVLADGKDWSPPIAPAGMDYYFTFEGAQHPVKAVGEEVFPGWTITNVQRFAKATVTNGAVTDTGTQDNPAVEVTISNNAGSVERHTCFRSFPDMVMSKLVEGEVRSNASLAATPATRQPETLVVFGPVAAPRFGYVDIRGAGREVPQPVTLPATLDLGSRRVTVLRQHDHARAATRFAKAPTASERRPAMVVRVDNRADPIVIPWKGFEHVTDASGRNLLLSYGPRFVPLPFTLQLKDFRKMDYPGTEMAMAYESQVVVTTPDAPDAEYLIHMNTPYANYPWKVYQSGFSGETISIFSVMRDPGLKLTYLGSTVLCVGIFLTFFSRSLSWGHPGIPAPHLHESSPHPAPKKEAVHAKLSQTPAAGIDLRAEPALAAQGR